MLSVRGAKAEYAMHHCLVNDVCNKAGDLNIVCKLYSEDVFLADVLYITIHIRTQKGICDDKSAQQSIN